MGKLQPFIHQNRERINKFMLDLCEVQDFYESLEMDNYVALSKRDLELSITLHEVYSAHGLLEKYSGELVCVNLTCFEDYECLRIPLAQGRKFRAAKLDAARTRSRPSTGEARGEQGHQPPALQQVGKPARRSHRRARHRTGRGLLYGSQVYLCRHSALHARQHARHAPAAAPRESRRGSRNHEERLRHGEEGHPMHRAAEPAAGAARHQQGRRLRAAARRNRAGARAPGLAEGKSGGGGQQAGAGVQDDSRSQSVSARPAGDVQVVPAQRAEPVRGQAEQAAQEPGSGPVQDYASAAGAGWGHSAEQRAREQAGEYLLQLYEPAAGQLCDFAALQGCVFAY